MSVDCALLSINSGALMLFNTDKRLAIATTFVSKSRLLAGAKRPAREVIMARRCRLSSIHSARACTEVNMSVSSLIDQKPALVCFAIFLSCNTESIFNVCFSTGFIPSEWGKGIVNPIPDSANNDPRDPISYRGITIAPSMYKLYCYVLNQRLSKWVESNNKLEDEQNGFRKNRSTIDHLSSLNNIIETRIKMRVSTFTAFIDFKKAYDTVDRNLLWDKLCKIGINGKMFKAVKSLYTTVSSCVRINGLKTEWFDVKTGLRQGCCLSPLLFNCFVNDYACKVKALDIGIDIGGESKACIMLYADDIVQMAETETDLQLMLKVTLS